MSRSAEYDLEKIELGDWPPFQSSGNIRRSEVERFCRMGHNRGGCCALAVIEGVDAPSRRGAPGRAPYLL